MLRKQMLRNWGLLKSCIHNSSTINRILSLGTTKVRMHWWTNVSSTVIPVAMQTHTMFVWRISTQRPPPADEPSAANSCRIGATWSATECLCSTGGWRSRVAGERSSLSPQWRHTSFPRAFQDAAPDLVEQEDVDPGTGQAKHPQARYRTRV